MDIKINNILKKENNLMKNKINKKESNKMINYSLQDLLTNF